VTDSILDSIKKLLGLDSTYTPFDTDVIIHINTAFFVLWQLGIGPTDSFSIEDNTATWSAFVGTDLNLNAVKSYIFIRVKMLFDPPTTSFVIDAYNAQLKEYEWRLNVKREGESWTDPTPTPPQPVQPWWEGF
jgi:hypothetical protein